MATSDSINESYFGSGFTAPGLPVIRRTVTGHHADGSAHFIVGDHGDHQQIRKANGMQAAETTLYSTFASPVNLNNDDDVNATQNDWQGGHHTTNGSRVTILDFSPGAETPMHRGESIDYNLVLEGEIELIMDSGEVTKLGRGDFNVQRATAHKWRNVTDNGKGPARLFNVLLDIAPLVINNQEIKGFSEGYSGPYGFGTGRRGHEESGTESK